MLVVWYIKHVRLYELHMYLMSICIAKRRPKQRKATRQSWRSQRCLCTNETFLFCLIYVFPLTFHTFRFWVHVKQELAEASLKATAFEQSLKGRVLSIKLSDSSDAPEPNIPKPSCAAEPSDAAKPSVPSDTAKPSDSGVLPPSLVESDASHVMPHHHVP